MFQVKSFRPIVLCHLLWCIAFSCSCRRDGAAHNSMTGLNAPVMCAIDGIDRMTPNVQMEIQAFLNREKVFERPISVEPFEYLESLFIDNRDFGYSLTMPKGYNKKLVTLPVGKVTYGQIILRIREVANVHVQITDAGIFEIAQPPEAR